MRCAKVLVLILFFAFCFFGNVFAVTYIPNTIKASNNLGLQVYFSFNENTATTVTDFSGKGNTGTLVNGPVWTTGRLSRATLFDGVDDVVNSSTAEIFPETGVLTISSWINAKSVGEIMKVVLSINPHQ